MVTEKNIRFIIHREVAMRWCRFSNYADNKVLINIPSSIDYVKEIDIKQRIKQDLENL